MSRQVLRTISEALYVALIYGFVFLPVVVLVLFSFQDGALPVPPFKGFSLQWYERVFDNSRLMSALGNSIVVGLVSSAVTTLLGFLAAYGLARHGFLFSGILQWLFIAPITVSYLVIGMGLLIYFSALGVPKSLTAVGIGHVVINLPLAFAIIYSQMGEHQANIERAGRDLGAAEWQVLTFVTTPTLWPSIFAAFCLSFTFSWDEFIVAFLLTRFDVTLPVELWGLLRRGINPETNAAGTVMFAVSIAFVIVIQAVLLWRRRRLRQE